jgi:hypothetical protein
MAGRSHVQLSHRPNRTANQACQGRLLFQLVADAPLSFTLRCHSAAQDTPTLTLTLTLTLTQATPMHYGPATRTLTIHSATLPDDVTHQHRPHGRQLAHPALVRHTWIRGLSSPLRPTTRSSDFVRVVRWIVLNLTLTLTLTLILTLILTLTLTFRYICSSGCTEYGGSLRTFFFCSNHELCHHTGDVTIHTAGRAPTWLWMS